MSIFHVGMALAGLAASLAGFDAIRSRNGGSWALCAINLSAMVLAGYLLKMN